MTPIATEGRPAIQAFVEHKHDEVAIGVNRLHQLAQDLQDLSVDQRAVRLTVVLSWVDQTVVPHMAWEERWLFPQIDERTRTPWATRLARFDHRQIEHQVARLRAHRSSLAHAASGTFVTEIRCDLFALEALLRSDIEREDRVLLPELERPADRWTEWMD